MSTPPLSRNNSSSSLGSQSEEKPDEGALAPSSKQKPQTQQKTRPRAGTWQSVRMPSEKEAEKKSEPMLSPRRVNAATTAATGATPQAPTAKPPTAKAPIGSSSQTPAPSSGAKPVSPSTSATPGKVSAASGGYDKSRASGDQIPDLIASALRAVFKGYATVPDPKNPSRTITVPVFNLQPKQIATLFVGLESNFGREPLAGEKMDKPLRDKFGITNFRLNEVTVFKDINFIDQILKPFIEKSFNTDAFEKTRREVRDRFNRFASKGNEVLLETTEGKNAKEATIQNLAFMTKFEPVILPLVDLICGEERKLGSSNLSTQFKDFLLEIDRSYSEWAEVQGKTVGNNPWAKDLVGPDWAKAYALANVARPASAEASEKEKTEYQKALAEACSHAPEAIFNLKKSALVGVMFNRALIENWVMKFHHESLDPNEAGQPWVRHKKKLNGCLGHYTSFKFDDLFIDIMGSQPYQPAGFKEYLGPLKKMADMRRAEEVANAAKQSNKRKGLERSSTVSTTGKSEKEKKGGIAGFIQGVVSPRKRAEEKEAPPETTVAKHHPGQNSRQAREPKKTVKSSEGELLKQAETRKMQMERGARSEMKAYLKKINLPVFDLGFTTYLNMIITKRANFEEFGIAPAAFCLLQLVEYRKSLESDGNMAPKTLDKIEETLAKLAIDEKIASEQTLRSQSAKAAPKLPALDLNALKRSPFAEEDTEPVKPETSSETEKSDSSEVRTESSSDSATEREKS